MDLVVSEVVFVDVWTPEVAPEIAAARARGAVLTCLADTVLERAGPRTLGVTGTAGKTTATDFAAQLLRSAGVDVLLPERGPSANLWPEETLLDRLDGDGRVVVELTSSHLAFCSHSPAIAVVTSFWPDHVELHGSVEAYARAKEAIVRHQGRDDWVVVAADGSCERFAAATPARVARFSPAGPVEQGAFVRDGRVAARWDGVEVEVCALEGLPVRGRAVASVLAACAGVLAAGVAPAALAAGARALVLPPHRHVEVGRVGGVPVYDDSMAGTPAKAAAALELFPDDSVVLVAGGRLAMSTAGPVHATPGEQELLHDACALAARKARRVILFGAAAEQLSPLLPGAERVPGLADAVEAALADTAGATAVLVAPMFPVSPAERDQVAAIVAAFVSRR